MAHRPVRDEWLLPTLEGLVARDAFEQLKQQETESYWDAAVRGGTIADDAILQALASRFRMKVADLSLATAQAREVVPESLARKYRIVPLAASDSALDIATADPHDLDCERMLAFATGRTVRMHLASPSAIVARIDELYQPESAVEKILEGVTGRYDIDTITEGGDDEDFNLSADRASERPVIRLVDHIIAEAIATRASDIHLEPEEGGVAVRYRIDGVLRDTMMLPRPAGLPLVSRIKIMAQMDIADRLRPQDGRARVSVNGNRVDLRVSTLPASYGEKVVIRILDSRSTVLSIDGLGLMPDEATRLNELVNLREGIVLVTGPTGSGKTTTLYSALRQIQQRAVNIVTVEDPVEYKLQGIVQVQVNEKAGLNFANALRSILRQDPDVILVGEIRDKETAGIAVQASLTGHLVLSTLHTIDAASSIARLVDIGIDPYKIAAALKGVVAQRLLRRLCPACKQPSTDHVSERMRRWLPHGMTLYNAAGCAECAQTGYRGRMAVMEVLTVSSEIERLIAKSETPDIVADAARADGMKTLWESGIEHVRAGITSLDELLRVVEPPVEVPVRRAASTRENGTDGARGRADVPGRTPAQTPPPASVAKSAPSALPEDALQLLDDLFDETFNGKKTVLLVEDEEPLRRVLRDLLEREGFTVVEAADGVQALDEVDRTAPDVLVLDLNLPRLDGYGVLSHLRARPSTSKLPVIVLTAKGDEENEVRVFESGANDFLTKPFRPRALSARLRALLKLKA
ncbi:MAG TPA: ATPase, T2SS/T4P/T4SS family [Gemmatimonadaceae bacterium]|jgi:type II secretory ATPase GspE/PulE/Tfp pilus assembly ATPase PilB-like protein|nr:ATPase, T2SS/T4P/T4SS family [Gemmatimonadaceae bacterium]